MTYEEIVAESKKWNDLVSVPPAERSAASSQLEVGQWPEDTPETTDVFTQGSREDFERATEARRGKMDQVRQARETEQRLKDADSTLGRTKAFVRDLFTPKSEPDRPIVASPESYDAPAPVAPEAPQAPHLASPIEPPSAPVPVAAPPTTPDGRPTPSISTERAPKPTPAQPLPNVPPPSPDWRQNIRQAQRTGPTLANPLPAPSDQDVPEARLLAERLSWEDRVAVGTAVEKLRKGRALPQDVQREIGAIYGNYLQGPQLNQAVSNTMRIAGFMAEQNDPDGLPPIAEMAERFKASHPQEQGPKVGPGKTLASTPVAPNQPIAQSPFAPAQSPAEPDFTLPEIPVTAERPTGTENDYINYDLPPGALTGPPLPPRSLSAAIVDATNHYIQGAVDVPAGFLRSISEFSTVVDDYLPEALKDPRKAEERMAYKMGEALTAFARKTWPTDPDRQDEFLGAVFPRALGSMTSFFAAAPFGVGGVAVAGAGATADEQYQDAIKHGATPEQAKLALLWGGAIGTTEAIPIARALDRINQASSGKLKHILLNAGKEAAEEFLQEFFQTTAGNVVARDIAKYDLERETFEGATEGGEAGGAAGFVMGLLLGGLGGRRKHATQPQPTAQGGAGAPPEPVEAPQTPAVPPGFDTEEDDDLVLPPAASAPVPTLADHVPVRPMEEPQKPAAKPAIVPKPDAMTDDMREAMDAELEEAAATEAPAPVQAEAETPAPKNEQIESEPIEKQEESGSDSIAPLAGAPSDRELYGEEEAPVPVEVAPVERPQAIEKPAPQEEGASELVPPVSVEAQAEPPVKESQKVDQPATVAALPEAEESASDTTKDLIEATDVLNAAQDTEAPSPVDAEAHEAATSPTNELSEPTDAQKEAGNYPKGHTRIAGLDISIKNPQGSTRSGVDAQGNPWSVQMQSHYGYIRGTQGKDKDHLDVFIKPGTPQDYNGPVFIVDQNKVNGKKPTKTFDEHKIILGAKDIGEARNLYLQNYKPGWKGMGALGETSMEKFKEWLKSGETNKPWMRKENTFRDSGPLPTRQARPTELQQAATADKPNQSKKPVPQEEGPAPGVTSQSEPTFNYTDQGKRPTTKQVMADWTKAGKPKKFTVEYGETYAEFEYLPDSIAKGWDAHGNGATGFKHDEILQALRREDVFTSDFKPPKGELISKPLSGGPESTIVPAEPEQSAPVPVQTEPEANPVRAAIEKVDKARESDTKPVDLKPEPEATLPVPTETKEAPHAEPVSPRVEDTRPPEGTPTQDVQGDAGQRDAVSVPEGAGNQGDQSNDLPRKPRRPKPVRSVGDREGSSAAPSGDGRAETGRDDAAVSRPAEPEKEEPAAGSDFRLTDDYTIPAGAKTKYRANVAAIKLLKQIEQDGRLATPDEQKTLAQYTGWGGLPQAFQYSRDWFNEYQELENLLTPDEYASARASTPNAHYTDPKTIRAIYEGLKHLGFKGGKLLEPGAGIGHFLGLLPGDLRSKTQKTAIEKDSLSARIAKQLYQRANVVHSPYQDVVLPENFFDVAVGNVPFANVQIFDPHSKDLTQKRFSLHDYYFAKALTQVRPGGIVAFITSRYTMDKVNGKLRDFITSKADFIGAMRLPNTQFKEIANTDVVTDIIVLQRREDGTAAGGESWGKSENFTVGKETIGLNEYYVRHPEQILGKLTTSGTMYRDNEATVEPDGRDMRQAIEDAFKRLPEKILRPRNKPASVSPRGLLEAMDATDDVKDGAFTIQNNALYVRRKHQFVPVEDISPTDLERAKGLINLREQTRQVLRTQLSGDDEKAIAETRRGLNTIYDRFVKKFGPVSGRNNKKLFSDDPDYSTIAALERDYDAKKNTAKKADIFTKRVIEYRPKPTQAATAKDAMLVSMNETGGLDWDRMSELTGKSIPDLQSELKGVIYKNPSGEFEPADAYLSGNIRKKLKEAEAAAKIDPNFKENVEALKAVIPEDLKPSQIDVKIGHGWIPTEYYAQFANHLFDTNGSTIKYNASVGAFAVSIPVGRHSGKNDTVWGTNRYAGTDIFQDALASRLPTVRDKVDDDKTVVNEKETLAAREKLDKMQQEFRSWLFNDPKRAETLARLYNDEFNAVRLRDYDGSHLTLPGQNPAITLKPHQKNVIWRALQSGNTLLAHVVGAGKTFEMIGIAMEARRLRMANKPMYVVPNHLVEYWRNAILALYPAAKVLATSKQDFEKANRQKLAGRIATGDWDGVVIAHSQMTKLPISIETFERFVNEQVSILEDYLREIKSERGEEKRQRNLVKELEKAKERLLNKLKARKKAIEERADAGVNFEETGVDMLLVDEADLFKNLWFPTRMTRVAGLPNTESSRAYDMFLKTQYLNKLTNQRGVIFATGTPVSNSMAEVFTMQRYLQPQLLEEQGLQHFDAWARQFGNAVTSMEMAPDGSGYRPRTRFAEFVNVPELTQMFRQVMDVKSQDDLKLPVPKLRTGKPINVTAKPSPALIEYTKQLIKRAEDLKKGRVDPREDNMLKITGDGRNAALDIRLRVPGAPEDKNGKVVMMINNVAEEYKKSTPVKGTQLIFLDLSTPKAADKPKETEDEDATAEEAENAEEATLRGSVYQEIKKKLIKKGIPEKEIAFIHDAKTDAQKEKLFKAVNAGEIRVLIGSTEKMGAGTNVQERLVASHNLDAPWRPRDIEQRNGRIIRQGNLLYENDPENFEVSVYNYATEAPSFDVYMWQTLESKAKTITQIMKGDPNMRTIQDVDTAVLSYAEMKAIASGNPMVLERVKVDTEMKKLSLLKSQWQDSKLRMRYELTTSIPAEISFFENGINRDKATLAVLEKHPADPFVMKVDGKEHTEKEDAGKAILRVLNDYLAEFAGKARVEAGHFQVGTFRGFPMEMTVFLDNDSKIKIAGEDTTSFPSDVSPTGLVSRIENAIAHFGTRVQNSEKKIASFEKKKKELEAAMALPYEHEEKLQQLQARLAEIDKALDLSKKDEVVAAAAEEASQEEKKGPLGILKSQRGSIPLGQLIPGRKNLPKVTDEIQGANGQAVMFPVEDTEKRYQVAKRGVGKKDLVPSIKEGIINLRKQAREFPELPDVPEYSQFRTALLTLQKQKGIAADKTIRRLHGIVGQFGPNKLDLFTRQVLLNDLVREAEEDRALPFGFTPETVAQAHEQVRELVQRNEDVAEAVQKRRQAWADVKARYQRAMRAIGQDRLADRISKEDYFRHQVLEYAGQRAKAPQTSIDRQGLRSPTGRGFTKQRHGSTLDINANYLQADFEVMAQMEFDIAVAKVVALVDRVHNIQGNLKRAAKDANNHAIYKMIRAEQTQMFGPDAEENAPSPMFQAWQKFKRDIAIGMDKVRKALEYKKDAPLSMEDLKAWANTEGHPAQPGALQAFKAMSERRQWIKEKLGKNFQTWEDLVPEGYQVWQPEPGNIFFMAESIPHRLAQQLLESVIPSAEITAEQLRSILAMGGPKEQFVIPDEVYHTLRSMALPVPNKILDSLKAIQGSWKQLMLLAPRRGIRYNLRNMLGDLEAATIGNPRSLRRIPEAMKDLWPVFFGKTEELKGEVRHWFERGGFQTTLQVQEMGDLNELKLFRAALMKAERGGLGSIPFKLITNYWKGMRLATDYREGILRYANYLEYLNQMRSNEAQKPRNYGASKPENVMALPDVRDRAFKLSNELLGAYDRVSHIGQNLRNYLYPFFSWVEVNFRRWKQMFKNAFRNIRETGRFGVTAAGVKAVGYTIRFGFLWAALQAWNHLKWPDEEKELDEATRNRPHIIFGRDEQGRIMFLDGISALGDLLSWFGLDTAPALTQDVLTHRLTLQEALTTMAKAPINKVVQGLTPFIKTPLELAMRASAYPDVFRPRPIQDRGEYVADQLTVGKEYRAAKGVPGPPLFGAEDAAGLVVRRTDPGSNAYADWNGIEDRWRERFGKSHDLHYQSPKAKALRHVAKAIQLGDAEQEAKWRAEYERLGGNKKGMLASVRALAPLSGLSKAERSQVLAGLTPEDRVILARAERYYMEKMMVVLPPHERSALTQKLRAQGWLVKTPAASPQRDFLTPDREADIPLATGP